MQARPISPKKVVEKKLLYKNIELVKDLNSVIRTGQKGAVLEVLDKNRVFAEFYDHNGNKIVLNNKSVFEIGVEQLKIIN